MVSEVSGVLQCNEVVHQIQDSVSNTARFLHILVNRTGRHENLLRTCNLGYQVQCYIDGGNEGASSSIMILFIIVIIIGLMLIFGLIYMCKKKNALERKIEALTSGSENITPFQDKECNGY